MEIGIILAVIALVVLAPVFFSIGTYNKLVSLRQNLQESWSGIETELRRRYDLIPNLVEVVKGYATHEKETLESVIAARNSGMKAIGSPAESELASKDFSLALGRLFSVTESYPQLQANENFKELSAQLSGIEHNIAQARRFYNANVREMNMACESFPSNIVANAFNFKRGVYFGIDNPDAFDPPKVTFSGRPQDEAPRIHIGDIEKIKDEA